ncbi:MAG: hypothetical protein AAGB00_00555 [Planctomycetota bacterium]
MKTSLRRLTNAVVLVAAGAGAYFAWPTLELLLRGGARERALDKLVEAPLNQVEVPGVVDPALGPVSVSAAGNALLAHCQVALERLASIRVDVLQTGTIKDQRVQTSGDYLQQGSGDDRRFRLWLKGRVGSSTCRVWQVCDGRFVFTDLAWDGAQSTAAGAASPGRQVLTRVDLARVRERFRRGERRGSPAPGSAAADLVRPGYWAGQGGLPMLVGALADNFDFGAPRQMYLRNEPVYAMIGRWKAARKRKLLTPPPGADAADPGKPRDPVAAPPRMPHHVLIAVGARDSFPHLIEYRGHADPLSAGALADDVRFVESAAPLLRVDLLAPRFGEPIAAEMFVYREPEGVDFYEATDERLRLVDSRHAPLTSSGQRR